MENHTEKRNVSRDTSLVIDPTSSKKKCWPKKTGSTHDGSERFACKIVKREQTLAIHELAYVLLEGSTGIDP